MNVQRRGKVNVRGCLRVRVFVCMPLVSVGSNGELIEGKFGTGQDGGQDKEGQRRFKKSKERQPRGSGSPTPSRAQFAVRSGFSPGMSQPARAPLNSGVRAWFAGDRVAGRSLFAARLCAVRDNANTTRDGRTERRGQVPRGFASSIKSLDECQNGMGWRCAAVCTAPKRVGGCCGFARWALRLSFAPANGHLASRRGGGSAGSWHLGHPYFVLFWSQQPPSLCQPHERRGESGPKWPRGRCSTPRPAESRGLEMGGGWWAVAQTAGRMPEAGHPSHNTYLMNPGSPSRLTVEVLCCANASRCWLGGPSLGLDWAW